MSLEGTIGIGLVFLSLLQVTDIIFFEGMLKPDQVKFSNFRLIEKYVSKIASTVKYQAFMCLNACTHPDSLPTMFKHFCLFPPCCFEV